MSTLLALFQQVLTTTAIVAGICAALIWFGRNMFEAKMKSYFDRVSEDYKFERRAHEQGARIAEYAALAINMEADEDVETYRRANQLSWELFLWLPDDVYRRLGRGVTGQRRELIEAMVAVRRALLGDRAGNLGPNDIIVHAPGAARNNNS